MPGDGGVALSSRLLVSGYKIRVIATCSSPGGKVGRFFARCFVAACLIGLVLYAFSAAREAAHLRQHPAHDAPADARARHRSPAPLRHALDQGLETLRLEAKKVLYDPYVAEQQAQKPRRKRANQPTFAPLASEPLRVSLSAKRILAAPGDPDVPPHTPWPLLADYKQYRASPGVKKAESTMVGWYTTFEVRASKPIKAFIGKLALRNRAGKALYVRELHFPVGDIDDKNPYVYMPGRTFHELTYFSRRENVANFGEILHTPQRELTVEWTPYFVCYVDGAMEGDAHAWRYIDGEGLPVHSWANGLPWIVHLQYPHEIPHVTGHTIYGE